MCERGTVSGTEDAMGCVLCASPPRGEPWQAISRRNTGNTINREPVEPHTAALDREPTEPIEPHAAPVGAPGLVGGSGEMKH